MTNILEVLFSDSIDSPVKYALVDLINVESITDHSTLVLSPIKTSDDVSGSKHADNGGNYSTYKIATEEDISRAVTLGYEYFSRAGEVYTEVIHQGGLKVIATRAFSKPLFISTSSLRFKALVDRYR